MSTRTNPVVTEYLARTQAALADLPGSEVQEIGEDIAPHLAEVAAELGENVTVDTLTQRLGTPEQYANEPRAAAGNPPAGAAGQPPPMPRTLLPLFALWALVLGVVVAFVLGLGGVRPSGDTVGAVLALCAPLFVALILIFTGQVRPAAVAELSEARRARRAVASLADGGVLLTLIDNAKVGWVLWPVVALAVLIVGGARSALACP